MKLHIKRLAFFLIVVILLSQTVITSLATDKTYTISTDDQGVSYIHYDNGISSPLISQQLKKEGDNYYFIDIMSNKYKVVNHDLSDYVSEFKSYESIKKLNGWYNAKLKNVSHTDDGKPLAATFYVDTDRRQKREPISQLDKSKWKEVTITYNQLVANDDKADLITLGMFYLNSPALIEMYRKETTSNTVSATLLGTDINNGLINQLYVFDVVSGKTLRLGLEDYYPLYLWANPVTEEDMTDDERGFWEEVVSFCESIFDDLSEILITLTSILTLNFATNAFNALLGMLGKLLINLIDILWQFFDTTDIFLNQQAISGLLKIFNLLGLILWIFGFVYSISEIAINQRGMNNIGDSIQDTIMNFVKSFAALLLYTTLPVPLYNFSGKLASAITDTEVIDSSLVFDLIHTVGLVNTLLTCIFVIVFIFSAVPVLFGTIKRSGILLILILVGALHMLNIPRGNWDAFWSWCRQIVALCFTNFVQLSLITISISICSTSVTNNAMSTFFLAIGVALCASEVPRIADRFGIDTSFSGNASSLANVVITAARMIATRGA